MAALDTLTHPLNYFGTFATKISKKCMLFHWAKKIPLNTVYSGKRVKQPHQQAHWSLMQAKSFRRNRLSRYMYFIATRLSWNVTSKILPMCALNLKWIPIQYEQYGWLCLWNQWQTQGKASRIEPSEVQSTYIRSTVSIEITDYMNYFFTCVISNSATC